MDFSGPSESSSPLPDEAALARSRYKILDLFQEILQDIKYYVDQNTLSKAKSLAQDLGITSGQLDRNLRHCSNLRSRILGPLEDLNNKIPKVSTYVMGGTSYNKNQADDIKEALDTTLHSLVVLLSNMKDPTPTDDLQKLSQAFYDDVVTQIDISRVKYKFPDCHPKLHRRIGVLNRLRRLRIHDGQYSFESGSNTSERQDLVSNSSQAGDVGKMEPHLIQEKDQPLSIPKIPLYISFPSDRDAICPFCMSSLKQGMNQNVWEEHVVDDLEPFMCTFGGCSQSYRTYGSRTDWEQHENSVHRTSASWICHDCDKTANSAESFKDHLRSAHSGLFAEQHLDKITGICKTVRPDDNPRPNCILCGARMTNKKNEFSHLSAHLLDLALFVLPKVEDAGESSRLIPEQQDSRSETIADQYPIEGLGWLQEFGQDDIVPFTQVQIPGHEAVSEVRCDIGPSTGATYAYKTFVYPTGSEKDERRHAETEANILKRLQHQHIVSVVGAYLQTRTLQTRSITLVLSPVCDGNLMDFIGPWRDKRKTVLKKWFGCLASALAYLHKMHVWHNDIKPGAIGIHSGKIVLYKFSIARIGDEGSDSDVRPSHFDPRYAAPEILDFDVRSHSSDIFSLGCVFFEMLATFSRNHSALERIPYYGTHPENLQKVISEFEGLPNDVIPVSKVCISMMSRKKSERPSADQVLESLIEACLRLDTLHVVGSSLVGKCVSGSVK